MEYTVLVEAAELRKAIVMPSGVGAGKVEVTIRPLNKGFDPTRYKAMVRGSRRRLDAELREMRKGWERRA